MLLNENRPTTSIPSAEESRQSGPWLAVVVIAATIVMLMMSLRLNQDAAPFAWFLRSLGRTVVFALGGTLAALALTACLSVSASLLHRRQPSRAFVNYAAAAGFLVGAGANTALTWYMTTFDAGIHRFMDEALTLDGFVELRVPR